MSRKKWAWPGKNTLISNNIEQNLPNAIDTILYEGHIKGKIRDPFMID